MTIAEFVECALRDARPLGLEVEQIRFEYRRGVISGLGLRCRSAEAPTERWTESVPLFQLERWASEAVTSMLQRAARALKFAAPPEDTESSEPEVARPGEFRHTQIEAA